MCARNALLYLLHTRQIYILSDELKRLLVDSLVSFHLTYAFVFLGTFPHSAVIAETAEPCY